jgi:hypothetical protein
MRRGVGLAGADAGAHELHVLDQFGQHALDMQMRVDIGRARDRAAEGQHELGLGQILGRGLVHDLRHRAGALEQPVAHFRVAVDEDALPRHQHVVEHRQPVALVEPRGERVIHRRGGVLVHD